MSKKKAPSLRGVGRPPAPTSAFGSARPKKASKKALSNLGAPGNLGAGLSAMPGQGAPSPMQGANLNQPTASFKHGGSVHGHKHMAHHHDDSRHSKNHSEHGHEAHRKMCHGGAM